MACFPQDGNIFPFPEAIKRKLIEEKQTKPDFSCVFSLRTKIKAYRLLPSPLPEPIPPPLPALPTSWSGSYCLIAAQAVCSAGLSGGCLGAEGTAPAPTPARGPPTISNTASTKDITWERDPWLKESLKTTDVTYKEGAHTTGQTPSWKGDSKAIRRCRGGPPPNLLAKIQGSHRAAGLSSGEGFPH